MVALLLDGAVGCMFDVLKSVNVCDPRHGHTDVCVVCLGGESGLGFLWFVWAFEGFVLFFCILHLIGASLTLLSRWLSTADLYIYSENSWRCDEHIVDWIP